MQGIPVVYRDGKFVPEAPVDLPEGKRCKVVEEKEEVVIPEFRFRETPDDVHDTEEIAAVLKLVDSIQPLMSIEEQDEIERRIMEARYASIGQVYRPERPNP